MRYALGNKEQFSKVYKKIVGSKFTILFLICVILLELVAFFQFDNYLHIYFLDIGQGDSILIKTPSYRYVLIDGGEGSGVLEELGEILPFWQRRIDLVVGTHADSDHIGGLVFVLEKYEVDRFITSDLEVVDFNLEKIKEIVVRKKIESSVVITGDKINIGELSIEVLWPQEGFEAENDNQNSVALKGEYGNLSFLLPGDIESEQEQLLISGLPSIQATILKLSHHGSKTATSEMFLQAVAPEYAVISCGKDNKFGHPAEEIIDRLEENSIKVFRTDIYGRIEFITDGNKVSKKLEK